MNKAEKTYFKEKFGKNLFQKKDVNMLLRNKYNKYYSLTNINSVNKINSEYIYDYEYQRYDSKLIYKDFEKNFYNLQNVHAKTIFTNCGMSAIFSVLHSLSNNRNFKIIFSKDIYFETQQIIKKLNLKKGKKIYYYDSISDSFNLDINKKNSIIIIDTTCYHSYFYEKSIYNLLLNNNIVILVRSHIKLDMLGLEYCYLGSISYIIPNSISLKNFELIKKVINDSMQICGNLGLNALENNIFPLLNDKKFLELNKKRITRINKNNEYFYSKINYSSKIKLQKHKLFSILIVENQNILELIQSIKKLAINSNGLFYFSSSFGLDYIALDTYLDFFSQKNTIRISIGDVSRKKIDNFFLYFMEYIYDKI